jgi:DNA-binding transcriptional ArsR family regulator
MPIRGSYELTRLFLSLSDVSRLDILNQLCEPASVIDLCRRFGLPVNEAERHLHRLDDVGLIVQLPNGDYVISDYGKVVVTFVEGISDVHDLLEYWERYSAAELPPHLRYLPSNLSHSFIANGGRLAAAAADIVREAKRFLWVVNYPLEEADVKAAELKILKQRREGADAAESESVRHFDDINTILLVNELRALVCFPKLIAPGRYQQDLSAGFLVNVSDVTYRLLVELFLATWNSYDKRG